MSSTLQEDQPIAWGVLGPDTVRIGGVPVDLRARPRLVLIRLLLEPNRTVTTSTLADFIWDDDQPKNAANSIARFIADLRAALGVHRGRITTAHAGYRIHVDDGELDVDVVRDILELAYRSGDIDDETDDDIDDETDPLDDRLAVGLAIAEVGPNPHLADVRTARPQTTVHDELRSAVVHAVSDHWIRAGRYDELTSVLESVLSERPLDERLWAALMTALHRTGRSADALRAGRRARRSHREAGLDVGERISDLESEILGVLDTGAQLTANGDAAHDGIPAARNRLIGRADVLADLDRLLETNRVVSIIGLGGVGKTRVALQVARTIETSGHDVHRVGLQSITDPTLVASAVATTIGVPSSVARIDAAALARSVRAQTFLLVLDNCEHLLEACRELVDAIVAAAPGATILTTSRLPLDCAHEHVARLATLASSDDPTITTPAAALFIDRASPHLTARPTADDLADMAAIARLLGGHPLAIELAAAQLGDVTLPGLLQRLTGVAAFASNTTTQGRRSDDAMHTLDTLMFWSWDRLSPHQQELLARLSTFRGGCTIDAAETVCESDRPLAADLAVLVGHGLVTMTGSGPGARYTMPEPVHGFAHDRLAERSAVEAFEDRLVRWMIDYTERWPIADTHVWADASAGLLLERHNLAVALRRLDESGRTEQLAWLAVRATGMWINHGFAQEVVRWLRPLVDDTDVSRSARSAAAAMLLSASHALGLLDDLTDLAMQSIELADDRPHDWIPAVASFMGMWSALSPAPLTAAEFNAIAQSVAERSASREANLAICALYPAHLEFNLRRYESAAARFGEALGRAERPGRLRLVAESGHGLALLMAGRIDEARDATDAWVSRASTDEWHYIVDLYRAIIRADTGDAASATGELATCMRGLRPAAVWGRADEIRATFGLLASSRGESRLAEELLGAVVVRDVLLLGVIAERLSAQRGTTDDAGWFGVLQDFWTRVLPEDDAAALPAHHALDYWTSGAHQAS
jgi:predicted ATPase/DNA-binding SARP family transcriptional activator